MHDFDGKIVLVTGASTGLGAALAVGAAVRGAKAVVINYANSAAEAEATAEAVRAAGAEAVLAQGDVSNDADCIAIVEKAKPFGRIDALANNAGVTKFAPAHGDLDALTREDFERVYAVNVIGPYQMIRAARSLLEASERAAVLMVSSIAAATGIGSSVAYAASKGALNTMTLSLARVLGPKIRVNAICPGFIDTPWHAKGLPDAVVHRLRDGAKTMTPLQAASTAEDIADAGLFFLSDASRHVTGETLLIDAGLHLGYATLSAR
ncbi:3-oxoacyl-[acyl-carrier protein] reductase [alpha proteobacterium U9-1i]|nr:3-oxoacyl-[acyl-carrier protein] reductase [alpha proteobacterium U9-1i]